jgi:hypothetical protein
MEFDVGLMEEVGRMTSKTCYIDFHPGNYGMAGRFFGRIRADAAGDLSDSRI